MPCRRCEARDVGESEQYPKCGFPETNFRQFTSDNWSCATLNALRILARELGEPIYREDQASILLPASTPGCFIVLSWYKRRGKTEGAWLFREDKRPIPLPLEEAERTLDAHS